MNEPVKPHQEPKFKRHDRVAVAAGPHAGKAGEVIGMRHGNKSVRVELSQEEHDKALEKNREAPKHRYDQVPFLDHVVQLDGLEQPVSIPQEQLAGEGASAAQAQPGAAEQAEQVASVPADDAADQSEVSVKVKRGSRR